MRWLHLGSTFAVVFLLATSGRAADTVQDFSAIFPPGGTDAPLLITAGSATFPAEIVDAWDGQALMLTPAENDLSNGASFNRVVAGAYDKLQIEFDLQFSLFDPPESGGADGLGFVYANTARYGTDNNSGTPGFSEEPNAADSFGIGFDIYDNGVPNDNGQQNAISLHYNGALVESVDLSTGDWDLLNMEVEEPLRAVIEVVPSGAGSNISVTVYNTESGEIATPFVDRFVDVLTPYDGRMVFGARTGGSNSEQIIDNIQLTHTPQGGGDPFVFLENFESYDLGPIEIPDEPPLPPLVGGTPFTPYRAGTVPGMKLLNDGVDPGPQEGHAQLTALAANQSNSIAFDQTSDVADNITATFKLRIDQAPASAADGMSVLLLDSVTYGETGELTGGFSESPNLAGALGIGFDIYDNDEEGNPDLVDPPDPAGCGGTGTCGDRRANHISLHWNGVQLGPGVRIDRSVLDLVNNEWNDVTVLAEQVEDGMLVTVAIVDGTDGDAVVPFSDYLVEGAEFLEGARIAFGARTGGANAQQMIDDVNVTWTGDVGKEGDYNGNGQLDAGDLDMQAQQMESANPDLAKYDENDDGAVNFADREVWVNDLKNTWIGDANLNGEFNSGDMVQVFARGLYETGNPAGWEDGDFNGDTVFGSGDMVAAFVGGGYEQGLKPNGPNAAVSAVPEPSSVVLVLIGLAGLMGMARRRNG